MSKKKIKEVTDKIIKAYKSTTSDQLGSYTGNVKRGDEPIQDADDL